MDANAILYYGNRTVLQAVEGLPAAHWETAGVCGVWSVKEIIAHLWTFELMLLDALGQFTDSNSPAPMLDQYLEQGGQAFNDIQVPRYSSRTAADVFAGYQDTFRKVHECAQQISPDALRQPGTIPWYGEEYALDDLIVYQYYGHKREHCAQIAVFRDTLK